MIDEGIRIRIKILKNKALVMEAVYGALVMIETN